MSIQIIKVPSEKKVRLNDNTKERRSRNRTTAFVVTTSSSTKHRGRRGGKKRKSAIEATQNAYATVKDSIASDDNDESSFVSNFTTLQLCNLLKDEETALPQHQTNDTTTANRLVEITGLVIGPINHITLRLFRIPPGASTFIEESKLNHMLRSGYSVQVIRENDRKPIWIIPATVQNFSN